MFAELEGVSGMTKFHALTPFEALERVDDPRGRVVRLPDLRVMAAVMVLEPPDRCGVMNIVTRGDGTKTGQLDHIKGAGPETLRQFAARLGFDSIAKPVRWVSSELGKFTRNAAGCLFGARDDADRSALFSRNLNSHPNRIHLQGRLVSRRSCGAIAVRRCPAHLRFETAECQETFQANPLPPCRSSHGQHRRQCQAPPRRPRQTAPSPARANLRPRFQPTRFRVREPERWC